MKGATRYSSVVNVCLSDQIAQALARKSDELGLKPSTFVRMVLAERLLTPQPPQPHPADAQPVQEVRHDHR